MKDFYVYFMTNWTGKVLYIGVTNNLERRVYEHKSHLHSGFTAQYHVTKLVYYEHFSDAQSAIGREKQLKKWRRDKKNFLVNKENPTWRDLSQDWE